MKKYIIFSFFIHIGIATALISWSGISVSEWTQNLFNRFISKEIIDEPVEIQEEPIKPIKKKQKAIAIRKQKPIIVQKPKAQPKSIEKIETSEPKEDITPEPPQNEIAENSNMENPAEETPQTKQVNNGEQNLEVQYNPVAIEQENNDSSNVEEPINIQEDNLSEPINEDTSESVANRDFEEINTDPQDLKKMIREVPLEADLKSSQTLMPVEGNPQWSYPQKARQNKNEGSVFLQYFVDETGFVDKIQLLKSSGYSILDNEALRIMARQRYQPGQSGWYKHQVDFKLKNM